MANEQDNNAEASSGDTLDNSEDIQYGEDTEGALVALKKLKEKLKVCTAERSEYLDGWQRAKADLANARKNFDAERIKTISFATEAAILEMLPVVESFEMAFSNKEAWESVDKNWRIGIEYIYNQMLKMLENHGVTQTNPLGELFNPAEHTAIETVPTEYPEKDHRIAEVIAKGYMMHDKIIRPAQVKTYRHEKN
ncbi:MAG: molecular chaperone GrpE [Parcubacteria group bacterium Gr01-1014_48]|nr:MAG: molecular chaperone GrpE [Parcubacteria group bacterium Greene0416_14]TSC72235.1 MAG: molecular chaperone GrpE [Parcubacteria group bacterium Gr01-1014_48]TSD01672.1 MAG: molecular chaperone GrpE [Parcubacteria group bacterium Greene1014_15]TSD07816.1 MAG: molecular chaperone GrpE [Parcubacteria group bacterium Greene0714_4]